MEGAYQEDMDIEEEGMKVEEEDMEGADDTTATTSTGKDGTQRKKRPRKDGKDRRPNQLLPDRHKITEVSANGYPLAPEEFVRGYGLQLACILRNTVPLHTENLRSEDNAHYRTLLLQSYMPDTSSLPSMTTRMSVGIV
jgi:hypothetical protein